MAAMRMTSRPGLVGSGGGAGGVKVHADRQTAASAAQVKRAENIIRGE
jgi:hypothetical protein